VLAVLPLGGLPSDAAGEDRRTAKPKSRVVKVMTRNIYLGGDIALPIGAPDKPTFEQRNTHLYEQVRKTSIRRRAPLLAREIARTKPDLIGLQEAALWRTGPKDDPAPATKVTYDNIRALRKALARRGLRYRLAAVQQQANVEGPTTKYGDARLTQRDAILVRKREGLKVVRGGGRQFKSRLSVPTPVGGVTSIRGYAYVDASIDGRRFRFVNTHLESFTPQQRLEGANELIAGPLRGNRPTIVVGDLNSDPRGDPPGEGDPAAYRRLIRSGMRDAWKKANPGKLGYACCLKNPDLSDKPPFPADRRIDHILIRGGIRSRKAVRVGLNRSNRTPSGLWPSDHGGVVATLQIPR